MNNEDITDTVSDRLHEIQTLLSSRREDLELKNKDELLDVIEGLQRQLLANCDLTCGPETAARFFNRKRSWIYEAMSRPKTKLQHRISDVVAREPGGLLFRMSDLIRLREQLFEGTFDA